MWPGLTGGAFSTGLVLEGGKFAVANTVEQNLIVGQRMLGPHGVTLHRCTVCGSAFKARSQLLYHVKTKHTGGRLMCAQCNCTFASQAGLKSHVMHIHEKRVKYQCETCGKGYSVRANYFDHIATHTGVKRYLCVLCQRQFTFKHSWKSHILNFHPHESSDV